MSDDTKKPDLSTDAGSMDAGSTPAPESHDPLHPPGAGPVILHGARSLTIEFTDGHTIQVSF